MSALSKIMRDTEDGMLMFWCPGCDCAHDVYVVVAEKRPCWGYNGNPDKPTFTPSINVTSTEMTEKGRADYQAWLDAGAPKSAPSEFETRPSVCHSFVTDGQIQFLNDCTHALAGQTVPLPERWL